MLLAWLPVFVIATIVHRNPIGAESIRRKLNEFVEDVRRALLDRASREAFLIHYRRREDELAWTNVLEIDDFYHDGFFAHFAGQGRQRWHYGCAHSITAGMETAYIAVHGGDWLAAGWEAENSMIWAPVNDRGLFWFDSRMIWEMVSSIIVVGGTLFGAFILSCKSPISFLYDVAGCGAFTGTSEFHYPFVCYFVPLLCQESMQLHNGITAIVRTISLTEIWTG